MKTLIWSHLSFLFSRLNKSSLLSFSSDTRWFSLLITLAALCWTHSCTSQNNRMVEDGRELWRPSDPCPCSTRATWNQLPRTMSGQLLNTSEDGDGHVSVCLVLRRPKQHNRCSLTSAKRDTYLQSADCSLANTVQYVVFFAARAHCWITYFFSTWKLRPFSAKLLPSQSVASLYFRMWLFNPRVRILHLLDFMDLFSAHLHFLLRSLWIAVLFSSILIIPSQFAIIYKLAGSTFYPVVHIINRNVKQY